MSLVSALEQLIKSYKVHQTEIHDSIQLHRKLLQSLEPHPLAGSEESEVVDNAETGAAASPGEREDIELLERALETALRVRSSSEPSKKHPVKSKLYGSSGEPGIAISSPMDAPQSSASCKESHATVKLTSKSGSHARKVHRKAGSSVCSSLVSRPANSNCHKQPKPTTNKKMIQKHPVSSVRVLNHKDGSGFGSAVHMSTLPDKTVKKDVPSASELGKTASVATPFSNTVVASSQADESRAGSVHQQIGRASSDQATKWQSLRNKQNRLWDKVIALQRKPVPGRSRFMERMRATFPKDWPCGSPDQTRAVVDRLTHRGHDLLLLRLAKEAPEEETSESDKALGHKDNSSDSSWTIEELMLTAEELQKSAHKVKQEWKAWDRWRPEGGCLCTTGADGVWGDGIAAPLPLTITYTAAEELQELERLRMRAALLQQEIHLEEALLDTLSPQVSSIEPGPGCPSATVLRELYSLLGEGGERFPAIVLDSESD
ncbi:uncharacterized protein tedc2 [Salarias fasciatus]|uniref:Uncharacterized LOC115386700 n=1 Tax=Salarias fasciatus TaxID=181472 RepID=A0A672I5M0_SALFA|nr:uncharacterized protein LOC115386700 [Salarias fasciatus]